MKYIHSFIHQSKHTYILLYTSKSLPPFRPTIILNTSSPSPNSPKIPAIRKTPTLHNPPALAKPRQKGTLPYIQGYVINR